MFQLISRTSADEEAAISVMEIAAASMTSDRSQTIPSTNMEGTAPESLNDSQIGTNEPSTNMEGIAPESLNDSRSGTNEDNIFARDNAEVIKPQEELLPLSFVNRVKNYPMLSTEWGRALEWVIRTSSDPDIHELAAKMVPQTYWTEKIMAETLITPIWVTLKACLNPEEHLQQVPTQERAVTCYIAIAHLSILTRYYLGSAELDSINKMYDIVHHPFEPWFGRLNSFNDNWVGVAFIAITREGRTSYGLRKNHSFSPSHSLTILMQEQALWLSHLITFTLADTDTNVNIWDSLTSAMVSITSSYSDHKQTCSNILLSLAVLWGYRPDSKLLGSLDKRLVFGSFMKL
ncbi:hypothetical protein M422DRAFT_243516 [Sphaerobolus stellatus SS14]|nr:hypothetical protein M422DRAFT_243516 [Sphaerobolus stellatus SS14]